MIRSARLAVMAAALAGPLWPNAETAKPNILLIVFDDLNDWVSPLGGHPQARTPNFERLARRGMTFTNAHITAPLCNPSRASLMSGMLSSSLGVYVNRQDWRKAEALSGKPVLPQFLQSGGYRTLGAGKLFHAATVSAQQFFGLLPAQGFDDYYPARDRQLPDEIRPVGRPRNKNPGFVSGFFDWSPIVAEDSAMADGQVVGWAGRRLREESDGPLFLGVGIYRPHLPWYVPDAYFALHPLERVELPATLANDLDDVPGAERYAGNQRVHRWVLASGNWKRGVQAYLACVSFADAMLGQLLDALDANGRAASTVIVAVSDHGYHLGEKDQWRKYTLWEDATHVPLLIVAPGVTTPGSRSSEPVSTLDIYPTLVDLAGLGQPSHLEGHSLRPLLEDPAAEWPHHAVTTYRFGNHSVRTRHYRYIRYSDGGEELYDHREDPHEWHNLAPLPRHDDVTRRLRLLLPTVNVEPIEAMWR